MASDPKEIKRKVEFTLTQRVRQKIPKSRITSGAQLVADLAKRDIYDRAAANQDVNGNKLPDYSEGYRKSKQRYIDGVKPVPRQKKNGKKRSFRVEPKTEWAAENVDDKGRRSGRTFADITVKFVRGIDDNGFIGGSFVLDAKSERSRKIIAYNMKMGYNWWGFPSPSSPRGRILIAMMKSVFKNHLGLRGGGNLSVYRGE